VLLLDAADFQEMNAVYAEFFPLAKPARTTVAATLMDARLRVEIECIAYLGNASNRMFDRQLGNLDRKKSKLATRSGKHHMCHTHINSEAYLSMSMLNIR